MEIFHLSFLSMVKHIRTLVSGGAEGGGGGGGGCGSVCS